MGRDGSDGDGEARGGGTYAGGDGDAVSRAGSERIERTAPLSRSGS